MLSLELIRGNYAWQSELLEIEQQDALQEKFIEWSPGIPEGGTKNSYFDAIISLYGFTALGIVPGVLFLKRGELKY